MRWAALAMLALLPLQWWAVGSTPLGPGKLHHIVILSFAALVLVRYRLRAHRAVLNSATAFVALNACMLIAWAAVDLYHGSAPLGSIQQFLYLAAFVGIATYFCRTATGRERQAVELLRAAAAVACVSLVLGFGIAMLVNDVNPVAVLTRAVAAADPVILQKEIFKSSFVGFGLGAEEVAGNLRHEVFGAVLLSMLISTWAMRVGTPVTRGQRVAYRAAMVVGAGLILTSLSRAVMIAAIMWPLIAGARSLLMGRLSSRELSVGLVSIATVGVLVFSGFGQVIWNRFTTDTVGYEARAENYVGAFAALENRWLTGGFKTAGLNVSSHNFVIDNWLRGGVFTALPATLLLVLLLVILLALVARLPREPDWMVPVAAALVLPLVRMGTRGGGLIPPVEWVALAFVAGVLASRWLVDRQRGSSLSRADGVETTTSAAGGNHR